MKNIILSADGESIVFSVPDAAADNLEKYCLEFCRWLKKSHDAQKYRTGLEICYNENDFIEYLNKYIFPNEKSVFVESLGWTELGDNLPEKYKSLPYFNF